MTALHVVQGENFAAIAVELKVAQSRFSEMSFTAAMLTLLTYGKLEQMERIAASCGIESLVVRDVILDEHRFTSLVSEAHRLFKAMIPFEGEIRAMIEARADA